MKVTRIEFNEDEVPSRIGVSITITEAAALVKLIGNMNDIQLRELVGKRKLSESLLNVFGSLNSRVVNTFYEDIDELIKSL